MSVKNYLVRELFSSGLSPMEHSKLLIPPPPPKGDFLLVWQKAFFLGLLLFLSSCVDPFEPEVGNIPESFVVVDGFINSQGRTTIKLSRTINLSADTVPPAELNAAVFIEDEAGTQYSLQQPYYLTEQNAGTYTSDNITLDPLKKYRLHFTTAAGKEYASDFVTVKTTPPIDAVTWQANADGLQIYVNSHDATNNTQYYRWKYEETWEFTSAFQSPYEYSNRAIIPRQEDIYHCWKTEPSAAIKISSTARLSQDVISDYILVKIPANSVKLGRRYSILVKQYALMPEEYTYYELLRKNTENIGSLFDPLPTQLTGNVHCLTNAAEAVIGFVGARSETERRIFIGREELPATWSGFTTGYESCARPDTVKIDYQLYKNIDDVIEYFSSGQSLPINSVSSTSGIPTLIGYTYSYPGCVDCRLRGTNVKPDFWK